MLRLHTGVAMCPFVSHQMMYWVLPALKNVIVTGASHAKALEPLWEIFGGLVHALEVSLPRQ
jgi:hypothetical protein